MTLKSEIEPFVDALKTRKKPVPASEVLGYIDRIVEIAERGEPVLQPAKPRQRKAPELDSESLEICLAHIDDSLKVLAQAAMDIMDPVDELMDMPQIGKEKRAELLQVLEACSFQDIVSQRLLIIRQHLTEGKPVNGVSTSLNGHKRDEIHEDDKLLNGPAVANDQAAMDQAAIDAMLNG